MSNIINADNGVSSGTPGIKYTADSSGIVQFQSSGANSLQIDASQYVSATVNSLGKGMIPAEQFYRLNTDLAGANATGAQSVLGVGVTLVGSTVYQFQASYILSKIAGSTSHTIGIGFGGTATINNINWQALVNYGGGTSGYTPWGLTANAATLASNSATNITSTTAITTVGEAYTAVIFGTVSINAGGTFIPQYTLSAAPGGAYTTAAGSYFKISPLGASGSNTSIGTWS